MSARRKRWERVYLPFLGFVECWLLIEAFLIGQGV